MSADGRAGVPDHTGDQPPRRPTEVVARGQVHGDGVDLAEHNTVEFDGGGYAQLAASMIEFVDTTAVINGTAGGVTVPRPFFASVRCTLYADATAAEIFAGTDIHPWSDRLAVFNAVRADLNARGRTSGSTGATITAPSIY